MCLTFEWWLSEWCSICSWVPPACCWEPLSPGPSWYSGPSDCVPVSSWSRKTDVWHSTDADTAVGEERNQQLLHGTQTAWCCQNIIIKFQYFKKGFISNSFGPSRFTGSSKVVFFKFHTLSSSMSCLTLAEAAPVYFFNLLSLSTSQSHRPFQAS